MIQRAMALTSFMGLAALTSLVACGGGDAASTATPEVTPSATADATPTEPAIADLRFEPPEAPEKGLQFISDDMVIPGGTEKQWCFFFTYNGPDVGVNIAQNWQNADYGHHAQLMQYNVAASDEFPDGSVFDCTEDDDLPMTDMEPIYIPADTFEPGFTEMNLPEGFATSLKSGARLVLQSHYINYRADPIMVRDVVNLHFVDVESVETWVAPWVTVYTNLELPPLEETEISFDCTWGDSIGPFNADVYLLSALGHMHEWGASFSVEHGLGGEEGAASTLYEIPEWDADFRDAPPMTSFDLDVYKVSPGDVFTTTCRWFNDTDSMIDFPQEMCVATGMAYSRDVDLKVPMLCDPS